MNKPKRLATGNKVKITDKASQHFGKTGILIEVRRVPVRMRLEYHWLIRLDGTNTMEVFAPEQLEKID
ncbi:MAG: hypothetical protein J7L78_00735 [Dehalococcoidales bacterium]|nr:hypothetical protein [Dehalococcoidales bacterium]